MKAELMLDVSQAHEFKLACRRAGYTNADIKRMCEGDNLVRLLPAVRGLTEVVIKKHLIDLDADPFVPDGWQVEKHRPGGQFEWDPAKVELYLSSEQQPGKWIRGDKLRQELENRPVFNANLLDFLLAHQELMPEKWKGKHMFFWGTIYRRVGGGLDVRFLCWGRQRWDWYCHWLDGGWDVDDPAAVLASPRTM